MPGTYPASPPTLSGDLLTVNRLLQTPAAIRRRLRTFVDLRFVSDQILTQRFTANGGAVSYEMSEPFVSDRAVTGVAPGSRYPMANLPTGTGGLASTVKWGQMVPVTDEEVKRSTYAGQVVDRNLQKVVNSVIAQVDGITMAAVASAVTTTQAASANWSAATPTILRDILLAKAKVAKQNLGYRPNVLLVDDNHYAYMMSDTAITNALRREESTNPIYTGTLEIIAGLIIVVSPTSQAVNPYVIDANQLGGMADESGISPGYAVSDLAVEVKSIRQDETDSWDLQGRRLTVPVIQEPGAACEITGSGT